MNFLVLILISFLVTLLGAPLAGAIARRLGGMDQPKALGLHSLPTPRTGGLAIYGAWLVALLLGILTGDTLADRPPHQIFAIVLTGTVAFILGFLDDLRGLPGQVRLLGQTAIACLVVASGIVAGGSTLTNPISIALSLFWIVVLMNAANFLDGMDGLVAGVSAVAAIIFAALAAMQSDFTSLTLAIILLGSCLGFLRSNAFPANMFMGDGGSLFLGLQLAVLGLLLASRQSSPSWLLAPAVVLAVPLLDILGAVVRRVRARRSLFSGDRFHIYDLLALRGLSCRQAVHTTWLATGVCGIAALLLVRQPWNWLSAAFVAAAIAATIAFGVRLGLFSLVHQQRVVDSAEVDPTWIPKHLERSLSSFRRRFSLRNRHIFIADCLVIPSSALLAFVMRLDGFGGDTRTYLAPALFMAAVALPVKAYVMWTMGLYAQAWRYAQRREAIALGQAVVISSTVLTGLMFVMFADDGLWHALTGTNSPSFPRTVIAIDALLSLYLLGTVRLAVKLFGPLSGQSKAARTLHEPAPIRRRVLLVGAGDAGAAVADEIRRNPGLGLVPVGFVDDDPGKQGMFVHGLKVLGMRTDIPNVVQRERVEQILLTMPTAPAEVVRETVTLCSGVKYSIVPGIYELIDEPVSISLSRKVRIEDLLGREPVSPDRCLTSGHLHGLSILVTGAGGSAGAELCRQIVQYSPGVLVLLGHGEQSIAQLHAELRRRAPGVRVVPAICDVRDAASIRTVVDQHQPSLIFHVAGHKRLSLMETQVAEVVSNNILGTLTVLQEAERARVGQVVYVSSDTAAEAISSLGLSKRVGEMMTCEVGRRAGLPYSVARLGTLIDGRDGLLPQFLEQMGAGGPITIAHPDFARCFLTVREAAQLLLSAAARKRSGEILLLDLGAPIKATDIAGQLIRMSGLRLGDDIDIDFSGLLPSERARLDQMTDAERAASVRCDQNVLAFPSPCDQVICKVQAVVDLAKHTEPEQVVTRLREIIAASLTKQPGLASSRTSGQAVDSGLGAPKRVEAFLSADPSTTS